MPIVSDDGVYENELQQVAAQYGLEASTEPAGALKSEEGTQTAPENNALYGLPNGFEGGVDWSKLNQPFGTIRSTSKEDTPIIAKTASPLVTITEGDVGEAINVGMGAGPASIAGVRAATLPKAAYELAVDAEKQGFNAQEIFKSTGFFKGADGQWRFEIDDSGAKYFPEKLAGGQKLLSDVLSHKELFEAYPELKFVKVRVSPNLGKGAQYSESIKLLELGPGAVKDKGILVHEIQHAIQGVEGTARGGAPGRSGKDYNLMLENDINRLRPTFLNLQNKELKGELLSSKEQGQLDYLRAVFKKYVDYSRAGDQQAREFYERLSGEVEARNAQHRVDLTPSERLRFNPVDSEDYSRAEQFTRRFISQTTPYVKKHPYSNEPEFQTY